MKEIKDMSVEELVVIQRETKERLLADIKLMLDLAVESGTQKEVMKWTRLYKAFLAELEVRNG